MTGAGPAIREEMNGIAEAPGKTWFWELAAGVIDADRCIQCGTCVAVCPSDSIGIGRNDLPMLVKMCTGCSLCWDFCPRGGLRYEATWPVPAPLVSPEAGPPAAPVPVPMPVVVRVPEPALARELPPEPAPAPVDWKITGGRGEGLGLVERSYTARVNPRLPGAQDGGVVSAILVAALEAGDIDGALLARESPTERWKGVAHLARTAAEVIECGGSFYNQTMALGHLDLKGYDDLPSHPRIAVVGTPCEIQGIRAMQSHDWNRGSARVDAVMLTIALLCTKSFDYEGLMLRQLRDKRGLDLDQVGKVDVIHGKMIVEDRQSQTMVCEPVRDFHGAALKGCDECADFLGRSADISVGSVGSPEGFSSVLVRSEVGARAFDRAVANLDVHDLQRPEALAKLDAYDRKVALASLQRDFDPDGPLFIEYDEHVASYEGTDRAPTVRK